MPVRGVRWLVLMCGLVVGSAHALDDAAIDRWLASMEALQEWGEGRPELADEAYTAEDPADLDFEGMLAEAAREHREVREILREHGYSDPQEWSTLGGRIFQAMMAAEMQAAPEIEGQMEQALRELEANPNVPDEQKAMIREQMEAQMGRLRGMYDDVPDGDIEAVQRRMADLRRVLD